MCYLQVSRTEAVSSDGASNALQAWDMLHGNLLLHGWTLTDVSFYTTELPEYMIVEAIRGLHADVLHVSAAVTYTLLVLTGGLLARGRAKGRDGVLRFLIAAGIMVAPQLGPGAFILIFQPDHTGTQVPLLVTWLVIDRAPRRWRWYVPFVVAALLAWVEVADRLVVLIGVAPLAAVCAVRAYQAVVQRRATAAVRLVRTVADRGGRRLGGDLLDRGQAHQRARRFFRAPRRQRPGPGQRDVVAPVADGRERDRAVRSGRVRHVVAGAQRGHRGGCTWSAWPWRCGPCGWCSGGSSAAMTSSPRCWPSGSSSTWSPTC